VNAWIWARLMTLNVSEVSFVALVEISDIFWKYYQKNYNYTYLFLYFCQNSCDDDRTVQTVKICTQIFLKHKT